MLAEINHKCKVFLAAQRGSTSTELFTATGGNYVGAVCLLTTTHSVSFDGKAALFVTERTFQEGMTPEQAWVLWIAGPDIYYQDYAHVDTISPVALKKIGPIICMTLNKQTYVIYKPIITENNYGFITCLIHKSGGYFSEIE